MLTNNPSFSSKQWMTQRQCVYELFHWHNTQLICVKCIKNSWMTISSVRISYPAECNCHLFVVKDIWEMSHVFSCLFRQVYINQCKFHIISSSHSTCTACTTMYYRFFNVWNKLLKCTYVHLSLFHSNLSNIQLEVWNWYIWRACFVINEKRNLWLSNWS